MAGQATDPSSSVASEPVTFEKHVPSCLLREGPFLSHEEGNAATAEFLFPGSGPTPGEGEAVHVTGKTLFIVFLLRMEGFDVLIFFGLAGSWLQCTGFLLVASLVSGYGL